MFLSDVSITSNYCLNYTMPHPFIKRLCGVGGGQHGADGSRTRPGADRTTDPVWRIHTQQRVRTYLAVLSNHVFNSIYVWKPVNHSYLCTVFLNWQRSSYVWNAVHSLWRKMKKTVRNVKIKWKETKQNNEINELFSHIDFFRFSWTLFQDNKLQMHWLCDVRGSWKSKYWVASWELND